MDSKKAINKLDYIDDVQLFRSVTMALWLYLDIEKTMKYSIDKSSEKRGGKKTHIEKAIRSVVPASLIKSRSKPNQSAKDSARASHVISWSLNKPR